MSVRLLLILSKIDLGILFFHVVFILEQILSALFYEKYLLDCLDDSLKMIKICYDICYVRSNLVGFLYIYRRNYYGYASWVKMYMIEA